MAHIKRRLPPRQVANAFHIYARLFVYVRRYWPALIIAGIASMAIPAYDAWFIRFLKPLLNQGLMEKDRAFLMWAPFLVLGVFMLRGVASFLSNYYIASGSRNVIMCLRQESFCTFTTFALAFLRSHHDRTSLVRVVVRR